MSVRRGMGISTMTDDPKNETDETDNTPHAESTQPENDVVVESGSQDAPDESAATPEIEIVQSLPVLPIKNTVVFPFTFSPLAVGRSMSLAAAEAALASEEKTVLLLTQRDPNVDLPTPQDLFTVGTKTVIKRMSRGEGAVHLIAQGIERVRVVKIEEKDDYLVAQVESFPAADDDEVKREALRREVREDVTRLLELAHPERASELGSVIDAADDALHMVFMIGSMLEIDFEKEQSILAAPDTSTALELLHQALQHELQIQELRHQISTKTRSELDDEQRKFLLRRQLAAIQEELGEDDSDAEDLAELRQALVDAELPDDARKEADRELKRLERMSSSASDYQVTRTYLETLTELPWNKATSDIIDIQRSRRILDEDHFGLDQVKDRIIEHLAVLKLNPDAHSPILCFVGPPGVGKTSLGQSIAKAIGREFERLSLGGLHDESELRGHRRTYIGAMPGRLIEAVRRAKVNNPVLMLDEVDKLGRDFRGDPAAAMLEILDPAQNHTFRDNYLNASFDLSNVFFICTANSLDTIPGPLLDRMEVLRLSGYTNEEKSEIARRYLIPRQLTNNGIDPELIDIPDETLRHVISRHTREAGVRQLERAIGKLCRKVAVRIAQHDMSPVTIHVEDLPEMLGKEVHRPEQSLDRIPPGVATGLAWTQAGGEILFIEATLLPNGSGIRTTGQLGDVMKESVQAAQSYIWAHADRFGIDSKVFQESGLHVHVPAGAVPKDGPSAGIAMVTALVSLLTDTPARSDTAMTGEITLTGRVLPIGGVKEKVLAARAAGIHRVVLPKDNETDLRDLPASVREDTEFHLIETIDEALAVTIGTMKPKADTLSV
jgi:ATP-dependent Lon protease